MIPRSKQVLKKALSSTTASPECLAKRSCVTGVNSPYFQIEHAPWSTEPVFRDTARSESFPVFRVMDWDGHAIDPNFILPFAEQELVDMYRNMHLTQAFDETFYRLARAGYISFYMQNTGEEALQVGSGKAWSPDDVLFFQYRELGTFLQRGFELQQCADVCFSNSVCTTSLPLYTQMPEMPGISHRMCSVVVMVIERVRDIPSNLHSFR